MVVEYTSISTTGGWSTNTVKQAYDLAFNMELNALPTCTMFIDKMPERLSHRGDSQLLQVTQNYSEASITAAKAILTEELDVDPVKLPATQTITLTPGERGFTNLRTLRLANRSMSPVDPEIARAIADHCAKVHDELLQDRILSGATQFYRGGGQTATNLVTTGNVATASMVRQAVTKLRANQAQPRDGQFYVGLVHPNVVYDLRSETGSGGWRVPNEYGTDQNQIWNGEFGAFEGVRWIQNARIRQANDGATAARVHRSYIMGREALAKSVVQEPEVRIAPTTDRLSRFHGIGWYSDLDYQVYRTKALVVFESFSAAV